MASSPTGSKLGSLYDAHGEKLRYLIVGAWNTAFGYGLFLILLAVIGPAVHSLSGSSSATVALVGANYYLVVQWLAWVVAVPQATLSMKYFAFRQKGAILPQIGRAYFVYLPAQGLSTLILWISVHVLHLSPQLGGLAAIALTTVFSYLGHKYFTFRLPLEVGEVVSPELIEGEEAAGGEGNDRSG